MSLHLCCALGFGSIVSSTGLGIPSLSDLPLPDIKFSKGDQSEVEDREAAAKCEVLPSGWPTKLDWGIYWVGPGDLTKKAKPRQQTRLGDPKSWFWHSRNTTEDWARDYYDPSRNTVIYMHGDSTTGAWSTKSCTRAGPRCRSKVCPEGITEDFVDLWIRKGWNVGFFYWDQFADKPGKECNLETERRIWFDHDGDGLHWASYTPTGESEWRPYDGPETTITDLCVTSVKEAMGDFYSGRTVRFVGRSLGAQLAVACAAKLHHQGHIAAPQRLSLLDPLFTSADYTFFGAAFQCNGVSVDDGVDSFARESTANYVRMLWVNKKVVTEVFGTSQVYSAMDGEAVKEMQKYSLWVIYKPSWCAGENHACEHRAVFPLYFLSLDKSPLRELASGRLAKANESNAKCAVPAASCSDAELRALVEEQLVTIHRQEFAQVPETRWVWSQSSGGNTLGGTDDAFSFSGGVDIEKVTPNPSIEDELRESVVILQREWGLGRKWHLGKSSGWSLQQLHAGLAALVGIAVMLMLPTVLGACRSARSAYDKLVTPADFDDDDEEEEEEAGSSCADETDSFMP